MNPKRLLPVSLMLLSALTVPAAAAAAQQSSEPALHVRTTRWQTGSTYYVDGVAWTPRAVVRTFVEGWQKAPRTRQWSRDTADARGNFSFQFYVPHDANEHGPLRLRMVDAATGRRGEMSIPLP
ncbi:hypothetical protein ACFYZ9_09075 [Streptomyces sp. NPDC001691]|uniref:hypothetical protein n=1 Tax=Streptomyces sp. NPDC001691 TaxID=3364600 RepID=UPI0036A29C62